jgi:predicted nucleic acid-binding protein
MSSPALYLLDTNIISELRKTRPQGAVKAWFESVPTTQIAIPAIVIGEIQAGVEATRLQDKQKALKIEVWLEAVLQFYKILPMDGPIFRQWTKLMSGKSDAVSTDAMIAATALEHRLVVATRNIKDI